MNSRKQAKQRRNRKRSRQLRERTLEVQRRASFETLEERMLLAADLGGVDLPVAEGEANIQYLPSTVQEGGDGYQSGSALGKTAEQVTEDYFKLNADQFGLDAGGIGDHRVVSEYLSQHTRVTHIVLQQQHNGLDVANALITINLNNDGSVLTASSSFVSGLNENSDPGTQVSISPQQAFFSAAQGMGLTLTENVNVVSESPVGQMDFELTGGGVASGRVRGQLIYVPTASGVSLAWKMNFQSVDIPAQNTAVVDAASGQLVYAYDNIHKASYTALELPTNDLDDGNMVTVVDPAQSPGSPFGWHDTNGVDGPEFTITRGNNTHVVIGDVQTGFNPINPSPDGGTDLVFNFPFDPTLSALDPVNSNSVATNVFYVVNTAHDVLYNYGFDEAAGNFQATNYTGVQGAGDHVQVHVQDPQEGPVGPTPPGPNCNATFATLPDGFAPYMNMGFCSVGLLNPIVRDFGLTNDVIVHEYTHGLTERLVAGPAVLNPPAPQFDAIHEGNSDYLALMFKMKDTTEPGTRVEMGPWIGLFPTPANRTDPGIRREGYSYDTTINPITFDQWNSNNSPKLLLGATVPNDESHNGGEIWASTLYDMTWELIAKYGGGTGAENFEPGFMDVAFESDLGKAVSKLSQSAAQQPAGGPSTIFTSTGPDFLDLTTGANNYAMQLFVDGLKLAPFSASFKQMRDSIMAADIGLTGGVNLDVIWKAFARRGLGFSADRLDLGPLAVPPGDPFNTAFDLPPTPADIAGNVFIDANENGIREINESPLPNVSLFIDLNGNGTRERLEPSTRSDDNGDYRFILFTGGEFKIHAEPVNDYVQTEPNVQQTPGGEPVDGSHEVFVVYGQSTSEIDFGFSPSDVELGVFGTKYEDINGNGIQDAALGESGVAGIYIYLDLDGDERIDFGEPAAITDSDGKYAISFSTAGAFTVREVQAPGWVTTEPALGHHDITIVSGLPVLGINFGNQAQDDYGDAPVPYPSLEADNGAVHGILPGFGLGAGEPDAELDAITNSAALGDDSDGIDDEDGVSINPDGFGVDQPIVKGLTATLNVTVSNGANSAGVLQAWIDYNQDEDWDDAGEQVLIDQAVVEGANTFTITVPDTATVGTSFARFRYGYERGIGPTGRALVGEVEDHQLLILDDKPIANDDFFPIQQDTINNVLDVIGGAGGGKDFPSSLGALTIVSLTDSDEIGQSSVTTANGGSASISADGLLVFYSPAPNFSGTEEVITYTVSDSVNVDSATITIQVNTTFPNAVAIDDYVDPALGADVNPPITTIDVLDNDIVGANGPLVLLPSGLTQPANGTAQVDVINNTILYTPNAGFYNLDSFTYTASDSQNNTTTANVSVQVSKEFGTCSPNPDLAECDNVINFFVETFDASGLVAQSTFDVGEEFTVKISVQDARSPEVDPPGNGVFAGYMDVLYDAGSVQVKQSLSTIDYSNFYPNVPRGIATVPGIINELGAVQAGFTPLGSGVFELASMTFIATTPGLTTIQLDQADVSPLQDTLVHILNSQPSSEAVVDHAVISFGSANLTVNSVGSGEGESLDASGDGYVTPMDALQVINDLNFYGARPLETGGEGETATPNHRYDVNGDDFISPSDVLAIITYLNNQSDGEGEAADLLSLLAEPVNVVATPEQIMSMAAPLDSTSLVSEQQADSPLVLPVQHATVAELPRQAAIESITLSRWMTSGSDENGTGDDDLESVLDSLADDVAEQWRVG